MSFYCYIFLSVHLNIVCKNIVCELALNCSFVLLPKQSVIQSFIFFVNSFLFIKELSITSQGGDLQNFLCKFVRLFL